MEPRFPPVSLLLSSTSTSTSTSTVDADDDWDSDCGNVVPLATGMKMTYSVVRSREPKELVMVQSSAVGTGQVRGPALIIVPAYNEGLTLGRLLTRLRELRPLDDVVVVDDGSTDDTAEIGRAAGATVLRHPVNIGYGATLQTGVLRALRRGHAAAAFLDGDGQHEPAELEKMLAPIRSGEADVVIGSRFLAPEMYRLGFLRRFGVWFFSMLVRSITGVAITDPTSGARALNRRAMRLYVSDGFPDEFPDVHAVILCHRAGLKLVEVPVIMYPSTKKRPMHRGATVPYYIFNVFFSILVSFMQTEKRMDEE